MGPDEIHPRVLKECAENLYFPLYCVMRQSLDQGKLPDIWKKANVTPIFKKGEKSVTGNYRPVSLTSHVCKLTEKIIRQALVQHLENHDLICDEQHGFRKARSCLTNLLSTLEDWTSMYDEGTAFDAIYLDFRKAFDTVPHGRLIYKLHKYGIRGNISAWIEDFLRDRKQRVIVNRSKSSWLKVSSGVPQGSVLGPVLFLLYINDLPAVISSSCKIFADDTKVYHQVLSLGDHDILQGDLENLAKWSKEWLLAFNEDKCKVLNVGKRNLKYNYTMNNKSLEKVTEEKDLGVIVTDSLTFSKHIGKIAAKANSILGMIKRTFSYFSKESLLTLYKSYVRPHLEFCVQAWSPFLKKDIIILEKVQRRATKLLAGITNLSYEERLRILQLTTLEDRRLRGDLIEMYKILNGFEYLNFESFFTRRV